MTSKRVIDILDLLVLNLPYYLDDYPVRAQGTTDGVQYSDEVVTVLADTDYELLLWKSETNHPDIDVELTEGYYDITFELKAGSATANLKWKLQARNKGGEWIDMCAEQTETAINTVYVEKTMIGLMDIKDGIDKMPFEMRLIFQSNEATPGVGTGRINGDTNIEAVGRMVQNF